MDTETTPTISDDKIDCYEVLRVAEEASAESLCRLASAERDVEGFEGRCRESLWNNKQFPCRVGMLPNGKIAVHVLVESASSENQLHIVEPYCLSEDGRFRE